MSKTIKPGFRCATQRCQNKVYNKKDVCHECASNVDDRKLYSQMFYGRGRGTTGHHELDKMMGVK